MQMIETGATALTVAEGQPLDTAAAAELAQALRRLRSDGGLVVRLADLAGGMMGRTMRFGSRSLGLVPGAQAAIQGVAEAALRRAFDIAVLRLEQEGETRRSRQLSGPVVALSGAVGGFIGMAGFVPDAAVTTLAIMREIARIAQEAGEDLADPGTREACLQVFALAPVEGAGLGEAGIGEAGMGEAGIGEARRREPEASYFSARLMLQGRPLTLLLADVARRFGVTLSQKFALQAIPVMGAVSGAMLNSAFLAHYRDLAKAHFTVRRLERRFGTAAVRAAAAAA